MSVRGQRLPLGEFTNSRLNRMSLLSSGNVVPVTATTGIAAATTTTTATTTTNGNISRNCVATLVNGTDENMVSFSLNNKLKPSLFQSSTFPSIGNDGMNNDRDILLNESPTNRILNTIITRRRFGNNYKSTNNITTNITKSSNVLQFTDTVTKDYSEVSKRLQVRLQFAYYKLQTKQMDLKFADLKNKMLSHNIANVKLSTNIHKPKRVDKKTTQSRVKRRKLVVSQGNYRTPAKNHPRISIDEVISNETRMSTPSTMVDTTNNTTTHHISMNTNQNGIFIPHTTITTTTINDDKNNDDDANETLAQHNNSTLLNCSMTPVRDPLKHFSTSPNEQIPVSNVVTVEETPMSVKAAKSLIQLFSSINT